MPPNDSVPELKLTRKYDYSKSGMAKEFTIRDALEVMMDGDCTGVAERASQTAGNTSRLVGVLIQTLYEQGILSKPVVLNLVSAVFKEKE